MIENSMTEVWHRLEAQLALKYPSILHSLRPSASSAQVEAYEELTGYALPIDVRDSYLIHDGVTPMIPAPDAPRLLSYFDWGHLQRCADLWKLHAEVEDHEFPSFAFTEEEDPSSWQNACLRPWEGIPPTWLPIGQAGDSSRFFVFVDVLPGPRGRIGQIGEFGEVSASLMAPSFRGYLEGLTVGLCSNQVTYVLKPRGWRYVADGRYFDMKSD
jgi:cell wall assembly regulator SMI1